LRGWRNEVFRCLHTVVVHAMSEVTEYERETAKLIDMRGKDQWADYEIRAITGIGGFLDQAIYALSFREEHFEMRDTQAISCKVCGGLFVESLGVMRRHRLSCGFS
jgi:hypothetical protein